MNKKCAFENNGNLCFMSFLFPNSNMKIDCKKGCFFKNNPETLESYKKLYPEKVKEFNELNKKKVS